MSASLGKRQREREKQEKVRAKAARKAARQAVAAETPSIGSVRSEAELIDDLSALHHALEAGEVDPEEFAARRDRIRTELEELG